MKNCKFLSLCLCLGTILLEIGALSAMEAPVQEKVSLRCTACRVRLDVSHKDIKIVSFEDIGRGNVASSSEEETPVTDKGSGSNSLKDRIMKNRIKAMKIAKEIEDEKDDGEDVIQKSERKTIDDTGFSGETYYKFVNHINNIKNAAAAIAKTAKPDTDMKDLDPIENANKILLAELIRAHEDEDIKLKKEKKRDKVTPKLFEKDHHVIIDEDSSDEYSIPLLPAVKFEAFESNKNPPSRTIPDSKFVTTTLKTTKYKTEIPKSFQKRKHKKYETKLKFQKTTVKKQTTFSEEMFSKKKVKAFDWIIKNETDRRNLEYKGIEDRIEWQATSVSKESSVEM